MFNELINNIQKLGIITAKDVERLSTTELLFLIIERLNGITSDAQSIHKIIEDFEYLLNTKTDELIPIEVNKLLDKWKKDGTLSQILNEDLLGGLEKTAIKPQIVFMFDDGYEGDATSIEMLDNLGLKGCFSLINSQLFQNGRLSLNKYHDAVVRGHEVVAHTVNHLDWRNSSSLTPTASDVRYEYGQSLKQLQQLGFDTHHVVVPFSSAKTTVYDEALKLGCQLVVGDEINNKNSGLNDKETLNTGLIKRVSMAQLGVEATKNKINEAIAQGKTLVLYDHEIGASGSLSPSELQQILLFVKEKINQNLCENHTISNALRRLSGINHPPVNLGILGKNHHEKLILTVDNGATLEKGTWGGTSKECHILTLPSTMNKGLYTIVESTMKIPQCLSDVNGAIAIDFNVLYGYSDASKYDMEVNVKFEGTNGAELKRVTFPKQTLKNNVQRITKTVYTPPGVDLDSVGQVTLAIRITKNEESDTLGKVIFSQIGLGLGTQLIVDPLENETKPLTDIITTRNYVASQSQSLIDVDRSDVIVVSPSTPVSITLPKGSEHIGKIRTLVFANSNSTLNSSDFSIKGNTNYTPSKGDAITLIYTPHLSGNWCEINRFIKA